jgi:hypothetical protein
MTDKDASRRVSHFANVDHNPKKPLEVLITVMTRDRGG